MYNVGFLRVQTIARILILEDCTRNVREVLTAVDVPDRKCSILVLLHHLSCQGKSRNVTKQGHQLVIGHLTRKERAAHLSRPLWRKSWYLLRVLLNFKADVFKPSLMGSVVVSPLRSVKIIPTWKEVTQFPVNNYLFRDNWNTDFLQISCKNKHSRLSQPSSLPSL